MTKKAQRQRDVMELIRRGVSQAKALESVGVPQATWYSWKRDAEFSAVVDDAIQAGELIKAELNGATIEGSTGEESYDTFIRLYVDSGQVEPSAQAAGLTTGQILAAINPLSGENYRAAFHRMFEDARNLLVIRAEDAIAENISKRGQGATADAKWLLERRKPEEYANRLKVKDESDPRKGHITQEQASAVLLRLLGDEPESAEKPN